MNDPELSRRTLISGAGLSFAAVAASGAASAAAAGTQAAHGRRFAGKVVLVTGGTSGMGAVTAQVLAAQAAQVVFCGRRVEEGRGVEKSIRDAGGDGLFVQTDVTDEAQVRALIATVESRHGRLDYAFNNVGTGSSSAPLHELATADFDLVMSTNLRGNFLQMKYEIPLMLRTGAGVIIGNSSVAGLRYLPNKAHYSGAKHGVNGMYCAAALAYADKGIRINVVCPGLIKTEKAMRYLSGNEHALDARIPMGHIGQSEDVAAAVMWLFSDEARYLTGAVLPIDGGQSVV